MSGQTSMLPIQRTGKKCILCVNMCPNATPTVNAPAPWPVLGKNMNLYVFGSFFCLVHWNLPILLFLLFYVTSQIFLNIFWYFQKKTFFVLTGWVKKKGDLEKNSHNSSEIHQKGKKLVCFGNLRTSSWWWAHRFLKLMHSRLSNSW